VCVSVYVCVCGLVFPFVEGVGKVFVKTTPKGVGALLRWAGRSLCSAQEALAFRSAELASKASNLIFEMSGAWVAQ